MGIVLGLLLAFALLLIGAPIGLSAANISLSAASSGIMVSSGIVLAVICSVLLTITKLYVKTKASEAFVRTGMGGLKVIRDGGAIVLPVIHQVVMVSLETIRLEVARRGEQALITSDKLRADIKAEFFVRVQPNDEAIQAAARSLGDKMAMSQAVASLIEDKLVSALRTAAARKTLEQLNSERDEFLKEVINLVTGDLTHNGFTLETVTISALDQTDESNLKVNNIFDAQGMRTIAEITQKNLTEKNSIVRQAEQERQAQDVAARKRILTLEQEKAEAEAQQAAQVSAVRADQDRLAKEKQIEAERQVQIAEVERLRQIEVAKRSQQREVEIAEREKVKAVVEAEQKVEVARRAQQEAIAKAEAQKALEEARLAQAETERTKARQEVITAEQIAEADRDKRKNVIAAEASAEKDYVVAQKSADAEAYRVKAQADARKASADAEAEAIRKKAAADAEAKKLTAEGERATLVAQAEGRRALEMVPVEVKAREVEVEQKRVEEVLKPELEARAQHGHAAQQFEIAKLQVEAEKQIKIAAANAMVNIYNKITANVFGTPEDVAKMGQSFAKGMGLAQTVEGFVDAASGDTLGAVTRVLETAEKLGSAAAQRLSPAAESPALPAEKEAKPTKAPRQPSQNGA